MTETTTKTTLVSQTNIRYDLSNLSKREKRYFGVMMSGNVLYLRGTPGFAKSAIGKSMCDKAVWWDENDPLKTRHKGIQYIDLRLSDKDETDLGSYPVLKNAIDQIIKFSELLEKGLIDQELFDNVKKKFASVLSADDVDQLSFAVPEWAIKSNSTPTVIHAEELNRCDIRVRNAALQLLNEKQIGSSFKFNNNVLWMSSGNKGEDDQTEVEEMDLALSNRIFILDHEMSADEWAQQYGREHCWDVLVDYLVNNPLEIYKKPPAGDIRYATPRSWTNFSNWILCMYGPKPNLAEVISDDDFLIVGAGAIGVTMTAFARYCTETVNVSIKDIYERWNEVKKDVVTFNRARTTELLNNLKLLQLETLETFNIENIILFLKSLCSEWVKEWEYKIDDMVTLEEYTYKCKKKNIGSDPRVECLKINQGDWEKVSETDSMKSHSNDDEITNYLLHLVDTMVAKNENRHKFIVRVFKHKAQIIQEWVNNGRHKDADGKPKLK